MSYRRNYIHYCLENYYKQGTLLMSKDKALEHRSQPIPRFDKIIGDHYAKMLSATKRDANVDKAAIEKRLNYFFGLDDGKSQGEEEVASVFKGLCDEMAKEVEKHGQNFNVNTGAVTEKGSGVSVRISGKERQYIRDAMRHINRNAASQEIATVLQDTKKLENKLTQYANEISNGLDKSQLSKMDQEMLKDIDTVKKCLATLRKYRKNKSRTNINDTANEAYKTYAETLGRIRKNSRAGDLLVVKDVQGKVIEYAFSLMEKNVKDFTKNHINSIYNSSDKKYQPVGATSEESIDLEDLAIEAFGVTMSGLAKAGVKLKTYSGTRKTDAEFTIGYNDDKEDKINLSLKSYKLNNKSKKIKLVDKSTLLDMLSFAFKDNEEFYFHYLNLASHGVNSLSSEAKAARLKAEYAVYLALGYKAMAGINKQTEARYFVVNDTSTIDKNRKYKIINIQDMFKQLVSKNIEKKNDIDGLFEVFDFKIGNKKTLPTIRNTWHGKENRRDVEEADVRISSIVKYLADTHVEVSLMKNALNTYSMKDEKD